MIVGPDIVFVHVMKCAGSFVTRALVDNGLGDDHHDVLMAHAPRCASTGPLWICLRPYWTARCS